MLLFVGIAWATAGLYIVHAQIPRNVLELPFEQTVRSAIPFFVPEGWAFFTRDPREPRLLPYRRGTDGIWAYAHAGPHADIRNVFGLDRISRAQGVEIGLLLGEFADTAWRTCTDAPTLCLDDQPPSVPITNHSPAPTLCGDVGLVRQEPVPWAWARVGSETTMPSTVVRLDIRC
jgi:antimicrobial peptide system SdpA family protein